jgi:hypothetical protein
MLGRRVILQLLLLLLLPFLPVTFLVHLQLLLLWIS